MRVNLDDTSRALLISFLHGVFPLLVLLDVINLEQDAMVIIQGMISVGVTLAFRVFNSGQGGTVAETVLSTPADSSVSVTVDPPVTPPAP